MANPAWKNFKSIKQFKNSKIMKQEDLKSVKRFLHLELSNQNAAEEFYFNETNKKYIGYVGSRGGIKYLSKKASNQINPFLNNQNNNFTNVHSYELYLKHVRNEELLLQKTLNKIKLIRHIFLILGILFFSGLFLIIIGFINGNGSSYDRESHQYIESPNNSLYMSLAYLGISAVVISLVLLGLSYFCEIKYHNIEQNFYSKIKLLDKDRYISMLFLKKSNSLSKQDLESLVKSLQSYKFDSLLFKSVKGIYLIKIGKDFNTDSYFLPIYVGMAKCISSRWNQHIKKIRQCLQTIETKSEMKYKKIVKYLTENNLTINDIEFYVLELDVNSSWTDIELRNNEKKWIELLESGSRGFNAIN